MNHKNRKVNPNLVKVASIKVLAYDRLEAMKIANNLSTLYYRHRESGTCVVTVAGGRIVKGKKDFNNAVSELEAQVRNTTNLSFSVLERNTVLLRNCSILKGGVVSDTVYAYFPHNASEGERVELFSYSYDKNDLSYLFWGTLVGNNIVSVDV